MAFAFPPPNTFTKKAENCMRLVQLLREPGCAALQNVLVQYSTKKYTKLSFDKMLLDPTAKACLKNLVGKGKPLTKGQWITLYGRHFPQENIHRLGKPENFDITLTFLLVKNLCGLAPPRVPHGSPPGTLPSWDTEPTAVDVSLEANLARIKFYRNYLCHHETGELPDHEFNVIFDLLKQAIADISATLHLLPPQWSITPVDLERFRIDPISQDDGEEIENMRKDWKQQDKEVLDELESIIDGQKQQKGLLQNIEQEQKSTKDWQKQYFDGQMGQLKKIQEDQKSIKVDLAEMKMKDELNRSQQETCDSTIQEEIRNLQNELCSHYSIHMAHIQRLPTDEDDTMSMKDTYVKLGVNKLVLKNTEKQIKPLEHYSQAFHIAEKGSHILVEGDPGMGKTTLVKKVTIDWVDVIENIEENVVQELKKFDLVFVVTLGFVQESKSLASLLIAQHGLTIEKKGLEKIILTHDRILLIFDGYDEYSVGICPQIDATIQKKLFKNLTVLMTSRPYKSTSFSTTQRLFQYHFQIEGFRTKDDMKEYVQRYFQEQTKADSFIPYFENADLFELSKCPLMLLFLCLLFEAEGQSLPRKSHILYLKLMGWFYERYLAKGGQCDIGLEEILIKVGKVALQGLLKGQLLFKRDEAENELGSDVFKIGLLSSKKIRGSTAANMLVSFPHKSIQDYVAGYFLSNSSDGWDTLDNVPSSKLQKHIVNLQMTLKFAVAISEKSLPHALCLYNSIHGSLLDFFSNCNRVVLDGGMKYDYQLTAEIIANCLLDLNMQCSLSSYSHPDPIVINKRNLDGSIPVKCSKAISLNALTARDIVDESQTVLACVQFDHPDSWIRWIGYCAFGIVTNSTAITIGGYRSIENQTKSKILKCLIGCGLESLSIIKLQNCDFAMTEKIEICHIPRNLRVLVLQCCEITDLTSEICKIVVKHPNLCVLDLYGNILDWHLVFSALSNCDLKHLRTLMLHDCDIPECFESLLVEFIRAQKDLVSLDLFNNPGMSNILPKMVLEASPSVFNLESLSLGPFILPTSTNALKAVISCSPNLRELKLGECYCDVSKEIIEKKGLEILDITCNSVWALRLAMISLHGHGYEIPKVLDVEYILRNIHKLQKLKEIIAMACYIGDYTMDQLIQNLHKNPNLKHIDFCYNPISEEKANICRAKYQSVDFLFNINDFSKLCGLDLPSYFS